MRVGESLKESEGVGDTLQFRDVFYTDFVVVDVLHRPAET